MAPLKCHQLYKVMEVVNDLASSHIKTNLQNYLSWLLLFPIKSNPVCPWSQWNVYLGFIITCDGKFGGSRGE